MSFSREAVGNDLQPAALFDKQTFKQIGRARRAAVGHRHNAGFEIVLKETADGSVGCVQDGRRGESCAIARDGA
jgi:hypothetical protein